MLQKKAHQLLVIRSFDVGTLDIEWARARSHDFYLPDLGMGSCLCSIRASPYFP
jgi:hypothetical protein